MLHLLDCASPFALFLRASYLLSLMLGCCSGFAVVIGNLMGGFFPFLSIFLIRKAGFSLSNLTRKKRNPLSSPNCSYTVI